MDLRKPKRFATFSFGLRKRKKNDQGSISKSTYGLHGAGIEEQKEVTLASLSVFQTYVSDLSLVCAVHVLSLYLCNNQCRVKLWPVATGVHHPKSAATFWFHRALCRFQLVVQLSGYNYTVFAGMISSCCE